jgi:hypothetical protein
VLDALVPRAEAGFDDFFSRVFQRHAGLLSAFLWTLQAAMEPPETRLTVFRAPPSTNLKLAHHRILTFQWSRRRQSLCQPQILRSEESMTMYVLIREDQNDHGFVDATVVGSFRNQKDTDAVLRT